MFSDTHNPSGVIQRSCYLGKPFGRYGVLLVMQTLAPHAVAYPGFGLRIILNDALREFVFRCSVSTGSVTLVLSLPQDGDHSVVMFLKFNRERKVSVTHSGTEGVLKNVSSRLKTFSDNHVLRLR